MKGIINVRIDDRLIHGQVAAFWTNALKASRLMVVNDAASNDDLARMTLKMATPHGINLSVLTLEKAAANITAGNYDGQRVMMIFKCPEDAWRLYELGVKFERLNIGNMSGGVGKKPITKAVSCDDNDIDFLKKLSAAGVEIYRQLTPDTPSENIMDMIK